MQILNFAVLATVFSAVDFASGAIIKKRQFCPIQDQVCAVKDLTNPPYIGDQTDGTKLVEVNDANDTSTDEPKEIEIPNLNRTSLEDINDDIKDIQITGLNDTITDDPTKIVDLGHLKNSTSIESNGTGIAITNNTHVLVNGSLPVPPPPPPVPSNATEVNVETARKEEIEGDLSLQHMINCPNQVYGLVEQIIKDASLLARAGVAAAKAGGFPFNFFFSADYNSTAQEILSRAADTLLERGERILFSCHDWEGACAKPGTRAWTGKRIYHVPDSTGQTGGRSKEIQVVTLCSKVFGWPFNNWPCSKPPVNFDTPAHVVLHEILHFKSVTLGQRVGDFVYGLDSCHALLVNGQPGLPVPQDSADCIALFASFAWELGFGRDDGRHGWRGEPCPDKWGPPLTYPTRITIGDGADIGLGF